MSHDYGPKFYKYLSNRYWVLANNPPYNLPSCVSGENYNVDSQVGLLRYTFVYSNTDDYKQKWNAQLIAALEIDESTLNQQR